MCGNIFFYSKDLKLISFYVMNYDLFNKRVFNMSKEDEMLEE